MYPHSLRQLGIALAIALFAAFLPADAFAMSAPAEQFQAAMRLTPRLDHGASIFELCAACHGRDGTGSAEERVPTIAGEAAPVLVMELVEFRFDDRHSIRVQSFMDRHHLTSQGLADVAAYVSSLPPRRPAPLRESHAAGQGAGLFESLCARCHGPQGEGDPAMLVPRLAGQHRTYLLEQLHDAVEGRRPSMQRDHARLLSGLSSEETEAITDYLARAAPAAAAQR